jgi:hypothetical protein
MDLISIAAAFLKGKQKTYSFLDISGVISHPSLGVYTLTGEGTGSISISQTGEKTSHEIAADGTTFVMQVSGDNGTIAISVQQTSNLHKWLLKWYNYLRMAETERSEWARASLLIRSISDEMTYQANGVSPQNLPAIEYQSQGQRFTWTLMCGEIKIS